jgi:hypothetical protein
VRHDFPLNQWREIAVTAVYNGMMELKLSDCEIQELADRCFAVVLNSPPGREIDAMARVLENAKADRLREQFPDEGLV